jgi:predicted hydrocarbon binding protein
VGGFTLARLYGCRGCARGPSREGCVFERDGMEAAFRAAFGPAARVRETQCRSHGAAECEFEVRH